jgi:hypothetical protein
MARTGDSVDIQVAKNKDWQTEKLYPYKAVAIIDQENKVDIGLISPASIEAYGKTLETGRMFANLKLEFKLGISRNDIDDKFADAEKYLEVQRDAIPEPERECRASALWHNNNRAIAGKMFTEVVTTRLQELRVDKIKIIGLQYETNELKDKQWQQDQGAVCRLGIESNPDSPIYDKRVLQVQEGDRWKNMGVLHSDAAYMPIGTQFTANINFSATKKDADIVLDPNSLKLPEIWHGLSPERVQKAVNLDAIIPALKQAIATASQKQPTMTEFVERLAAEQVGIKAQVQSGGRINGITYLYEGQAVKASLVELTWKNLAAMGVRYDPVRDREAITLAPIPVMTQTSDRLEIQSENQDKAIPEVSIVTSIQREKPEKPVEIMGKPIQMVYPLKMHGEVNRLPVDTCIEAMRGHGRSHTTRRFEPYAAYNFKEGDIAIAYAGEQKVAFQVGKQYKISQEMLTDGEYQKQWVGMEKHGAKELLTFQGHSNTWGMHFQPLGDYVDGKIVPFPIIERATNSIVADIQKLEAWRETAQYLGKSEKYVDRIQEIIAGESISEKSQQAMSKDGQLLSQHIASQWREVLATPSEYVGSQNGNLIFERKGNEGKYRATWEQSTDTLTLDAKALRQGNIEYVPLLVQKGLEIVQSQVTVKDAQNVDRALKVIAESQKGRQEQR